MPGDSVGQRVTMDVTQSAVRPQLQLSQGRLSLSIECWLTSHTNKSRLRNCFTAEVHTHAAILAVGLAGQLVSCVGVRGVSVAGAA